MGTPTHQKVCSSYIMFSPAQLASTRQLAYPETT